MQVPDPLFATLDLNALAPGFEAVSGFGIGGIAVLMALIALVVYVRPEPRRWRGAVVFFSLLFLLTAVAAGSGMLLSFPPGALLLFLVVVIVPFGLGCSKIGARLAAENSFVVLVAFQIFRLPLELLMHHAAKVDVAPAWLTYSGYNFDISTGIAALLLAGLLCFRGSVGRAWIWAFNVLGLVNLTVIAVLAFCGTPFIRAFGDDQINLWVLTFPYVWLPTVLVVLALCGHLVLTRKLLGPRSSKA